MTNMRRDYNCPLCEKTHDIEIVERMTEFETKGEMVTFKETVYFCDQSGEVFTPSKVLNQNLLNIKDAYRVKVGLLTSSDIKSIRKKYELSQKELALILGWGEVTIQRYEKKKVQDVTYDNVLRLFNDDQLFALKLLKSNQNSFDDKRYNVIKKKIIDVSEENGLNYFNIRELEIEYAKYGEENSNNGKKELDIDKLNNIVGYFANFVQGLYKVKLMNLLWYSDFEHYKKFGQSITGLVYMHAPMGAFPVGFESIIKLPSVKVEFEYFEGDKEACRVTKNSEIPIDKFTSDELAVLTDVVEKFKNMITQDIVDYMHEEIAYKQTSKFEIISYELAKENRKI